MLSRSSALRTITVLVIAALLLNTLAPVASAQDGGGNVYLPAVSGGQSGAVEDPVPPGRLQYYRTSVEVNTPAQWQSLARIDPVIVARGENWALLLVDDQQLADLARLRFNPANTNALTTLDAAARSQGGQLPMGLAALAGQVHTAAQLTASDQQAAVAQRATLRSQAKALTSTDLSALAAAASVDTDADGLTDDQESFWCTDPTRPDSDGDATKDGAEVAKLKDWVNNKLSQAPTTRKPFAGWPNQTTCLDDDYDSIPDLAEWNELGLRGDTESTDFDKFDDGEEVFGVTKCPGGSNNCSYGDLPRSADAGFVGADMPSWVKAPGNHPLVAAFPVPEVDVVESSWHMETVTTVTTDHVIASGTEKTYSTAKTEGTSTSVADTQTWNEWVEVSDAISRPASTVTAAGGASADWSWGQTGSLTMGALTLVGAAATAIGGCGLGTAASVATAGAGAAVGIPLCIASIAGAAAEGYQAGEYIRDAFWPDNGQTQVGTNVYIPVQERTKPIAGQAGEAAAQQATVVNQGYNPSGYLSSYVGTSLSVQSNQVLSNQLYEIRNAIAAPRATHTETRGQSHGGSQTTTHEQYEEHTVTNGEAFSTDESWGTATAVDSAHAADLWFSYRVRNTGTEYAREIANLAFNVYIGGDPNPAYTYFVAPDIGGDGKFVNFKPDEEHLYTSRRIPLSLNQMRTIDLGGPIRVVIEDYSYGSDEFFYQRAADAGIVVAVEDGTADGDESIDSYLVPTWMSGETVLDVLARYFPHETDLSGNLLAIWTPEYRSDNPTWCQGGWRSVDYPTKVLWCKHTISSADWWNVYTDGLGDGTEGFQDTPAAPGATAFFRFNQDTDRDGFSDRSEHELGTDPKDGASFPQRELLAGVHSIRAGSKVTSTLSLLNRGISDAYGIEAVMVAPDDSITIGNNTVGGAGRVRALKQMIVGSRVLFPSPLPAPWSQANHSVPAAGGYYTGDQDATYTFTVANCPAGGCKVGEGSWNLNWSGGGAIGSLNFAAGYKSPIFLPVAQGMTLALYSGNVQNGESFTVNALTPRDTFQYTINRDNYTPPIVIVSYNDPQGNHRFVVPPQAMNLAAPTDDLRTYAGQMLDGVGVDLVTSAPFAPGANSLKLLVNNPSSSSLQNAHLFLEFINMTGTVVSEVPTQINLPPGPTYTTVNWNSSSFNPPYNPQEDYIVMAFLTDYQGNILDTAGRPLSSFQADPLPKLAYDAAALTWNFGTVPVGTLIKRPLALANTGFGTLSVYLGPAPGLTLSRRAEQVGGADLANYELQLSTRSLPVGAYDQSVTIATSDPDRPLLTLRVLGTVAASTGDSAGGTVQHPMDVAVNVSGDHSQGEWYNFTHALGPEPQSLHPIQVRSADYSRLYGLGRYAPSLSPLGESAYSMFGDGADGDLLVPAGTTKYLNEPASHLIGSVAVGQRAIPLWTTAGFHVGDEVMILQTQGSDAGKYEFGYIVDVKAQEITLAQGTRNSFIGSPGVCGGEYLAQYFNNKTLSGTPVLERCESSISLAPETGSPHPAVAADNYSVRWSGRKYVAQAGTYNLGAWADDGIRVYIDGNLVLNEWHDAATFYSYSAGLSAGWHTIVVEYYEYGNFSFASTSIPGESQSAFVVRVPHYRQVSVEAGATLAASPWNGRTGGTLVFRASDAANVRGQLTADGAGYRGGEESLTTQPGTHAGEGNTGFLNDFHRDCWDNRNANGNGGGSGHAWIPDGWGIERYSSGGGGGANGGDGAGGACMEAKDRCWCAGGGGYPIFNTDPERLMFGGGGGSGGAGKDSTENGQAGGSGGGLVFIGGQSLSVTGSVTANGSKGKNVLGYNQNAGAGGGGGAGGSIYLLGGTINSTGAINATGGAGGASIGQGGGGGQGGVGKVKFAYCETSSGSSVPAASTEKRTCFIVEQVESTPYTNGRLSLPETFTGGRTYVVQYGRRLNFATAGQQVPTLRIPAGLQSSTNLQLLASGLAGSTAASIDVGNDGIVEWSSPVANNSTTELPDLSAAFNAYWAASGAPATGTIDVPVKVTSGGAGQFLLTNLRTTGAASRLRHLYLPAQTYTKFLLDLSVGDAGQAGVTAAVDLGDNGSIDWHTPAAGPGPARWTTGDLAAALNAYLAGKSGTVDVPIRVYVSPSGGATLNDYTAAAVALADLSAATPTMVVPVALAGAGTSAAPANEGVTVRLATTLRNTGSGASGPLTAAFYAAVPNWGNWYLGSVYVANLVAGASVPTAIDWNTLDFGGVTAIKVVVNPYGTTGETNLANNTASLPVTIVPLHPAPVVDFSATPITGGAPLSVSFADLTTGEVTSRSWQFGDGATATVANPSHTYTAIGTYTVTLSAEGPGGSDWERKTAYIIVTDQPVPPTAAFVGSPTSGPTPLAVQFTDQSTGTITGWQWDFGDGQTSTAQNPSHTFTSVGSYVVSLKVSGPGGEHSKQMPAYITVTPPAPVAAFSADVTSGTVPLAVRFTDNSTGVITGRSWSFGDGGTSTAQNPAHSYAAAGSYTVALTVTGPGGSDGEVKTGYITVAAVPPPPPDAPVAGFSANIISGTAPLVVQFTDASTGSITGRSWNFGDGGTSTAQSPAHTYEEAGVYDVSLAVTGAGGSDSELKSAYISVVDGRPSGNSMLMLPGGGTLQFTLGTMTVILTLPPGAVDEPVVMSFGEAAGPPATGGLLLAGKAFGITAKTQNGAAYTSFKLPYTLVIKYGDVDVGGIDESRLQLHYWSDAQGAWIAVPGTADAGNNTFTALLDHLTVFGLLERAAAAREEHLYLPSLKR